MSENRAFAEKFDFSYPLICDTTRDIGMAYGACSTPEDGYARRITVLISAEGRIERVIDVTNAKDHPAELLATL